MTKYLRNYLLCLISYIGLVEFCIYTSVHHWDIDGFVGGNLIFLLAVGGVGLFISGIIALVEGYFTR